VPSDYFLKLEGIAGESFDAKHKDEIELVSFSWGVTAQTGPAGPGGGVGKAQLTDIEIAKRIDKASPMLFLACASGKHIKEATLTVRKAGKDQLEYLKYKFSDILISGYHESGGGEDLPLDLVRFNFAKIEISYAPQKPDGSLGAPVKAGWDLKQNKKI
jgi:type VI secretion system secreted protein Hcp